MADVAKRRDPIGVLKAVLDRGSVSASLDDGRRVLLIPSASDATKSYRVEFDQAGRGVCDCLDFLYRRRECKHIEAARLLATTPEPVTWEIDLPMPPSKLTKNAARRLHYHERAAEEADYGAAVRVCVLQAHPGQTFPRFLCARLELQFVHKTAHRHDNDGLHLSFAAGLDALVQLGILPDDDAEHIPTTTISQRIDRTRPPHVLVRLTGILGDGHE